MFRRSSFFLIGAGGVMLVGAVVLVMTGPLYFPVRVVGEEQSDRAGLPRNFNGMYSRGKSAPSKLENEIRGLSLREVRAALPAPTTRFNPLLLQGKDRKVDLLFQRLGSLEGEGALDEILSRYGDGDRALAGYAMTQAILGWMKVDETAALAAFNELVEFGHSETHFSCRMEWKGQEIQSGSG